MKYWYYTIFILTIFPKQALAYVDPGSLSYFFSIFLAVIVGSAFAIKIFWAKIINFIKKLFSRK